ncbi:IclR family transcriptional regulator [Caulobacter sp. Root655]|uniref:IclR family transcriptional regulator n=1 Tax=Caulobacter sp. Root655 TaxID=1736578 RepID=UPI000B1640C4|nr:IclR family transcriptional regulator [Caulobacter sp. Root655]
MRGLDLLDIVAQVGPIPLKALTDRIGLTRSTTHRLAAALVERNFLRLGVKGYELGAKLLQLDAVARTHLSLPTLARPYLEDLARLHGDAVNLAIREGGDIRYVDQVRGSRRVEIRSVIGERRPLASTGLGRAMLLDDGEAAWRAAFHDNPDRPGGVDAEVVWMGRMEIFKAQGAAFDVEENADKVRCVAAPIRGASGAVVAALSVSSVPQYMDDGRMAALVDPVRAAARAISIDLGWRPD